MLGETKDFLLAFVVFAIHVGEECDFFTPIESGAKAQVKAQSLADTGDPEFRAGGREDEDVSVLFVFGNFIENFRVGEFWEPVGEEIFYVGVEFFPAHAPEVAMKDTLHPARAEDFVERE